MFQVWRPASELAKSVSSANGLPILSRHVATSAEDHPADIVVGATMGDAIWDPPFVRVSLVIWDAGAIDAIEDGSAEQISAGYRYAYLPVAGSWMGKRYSGVMADIEFNHLALVESGRAGPTVMVHDEFRFRELRAAIGVAA
jgi:uncharacterized protein